MSNKIYVGNMSYNTTEEQLNDLFSEYGEIVESKIIYDKMTQRSKGFGFITFQETESCQNSIDAINGKEVEGRVLKVNFAHDKPRNNNSRFRR